MQQRGSGEKPESFSFYLTTHHNIKLTAVRSEAATITRTTALYAGRHSKDTTGCLFILCGDTRRHKEMSDLVYHKTSPFLPAQLHECMNISKLYACVFKMKFDVNTEC